MTIQIEQIQKEMKVISKKVNLGVKIIFVGLLLCLATGGGHLFWRHWILGSVFSGIPLALFLFALSGLMIVQPEDRIMVEFLGKAYRILKPGLRWVCPFLMKRRMIAFTWEQPIRLFPERRYPNGIHIDFRNGGKAELVEPILWVQMKEVGTNQENENVLRMVYSIDDWGRAVQEAAEDALRTCLNNLTVDDALSATHDSNRASWWEAVKESFPDLEGTINSYGLVPKRLTISDFNWDSQVVAIRQKILEEERSIKFAELSRKAAKDEVTQRAMEMGGLYGKVVTLLTQKQYGEHSQEQAEKIALELVLYYRGTETGSLIDARAGEGSIAPLLSTVLAIARGIKGKPKLSVPDSKTSKPRKEETEE